MSLASLLLFLASSPAQPVINTVAGSGRSLLGLGGPAIAVALAQPQFLATDATGNIYVSDDVYDVVVKISTDGKMNLIAGTGRFEFNGEEGPAASISFRLPQGIVIDRAGNLYLADSENQLVRKVTPDGELSTFAGCRCFSWGEGGPAVQAWLGNIGSIAADPAGDLYITDLYHHIVRKVDAEGLITTVVGFVPATNFPFNTNQGFSGDGGLATEAFLNYPSNLTFDGEGNMFISDSGNNRIRKVTPDGIITTVAGGGSKRPQDGLQALEIELSGPSDVRIDALGNLLIADTYQHIVLKVSPSGIVKIVAGAVFARGFSGDGGPAPQALLNNPYAVALDSGGNILVADTDNARIRTITPDGIIQTIAGSGGTNYGGDGGLATQAFLDRPRDVAMDLTGNLYVADTGNHRVRKITPSGSISTVAGTGSPGFSGDNGPALAAALNSPSGVVADLQGNVYISDTNNNRVRKVGRDGNIATVAGSDASCSNNEGVTAVNGCVPLPQGIAVDPSGNLLIAAAGNHRVRMVDQAGIVRTVAGNGTSAFSGDGGPAVSASLWGPSAVAFDARGGFYIADTYNQRVRYVAANGIISTVAGNGTTGDGGSTIATQAAIEYPSGVAVGPDGSFYVSSGGSDIVKVTLEGTISRIAGDANEQSAASGFSGDGGPSLGALMNLPQGVAFDNAGNIYVADTKNDRVRKITLVPATSITIQTNPSGLQFSMDGGTPQTAPQTLSLAQGSHIIAVTTTQPGDSVTQYVFTAWSDGGAASHSMTVGSTVATYTATFKTQYQLNLSVSPNGGGTVSPNDSGFYDADANVPICAIANPGYVFTGWTGNVADVNRPFTTVSMEAPESAVANFFAKRTNRVSPNDPIVVGPPTGCLAVR